MRPDLLERAAALAREGEPFVLATVVWSRAPSSGKPGSTALITADRKIHGWLGGACAEPTVIREGLKALEEGQPKVLFLGTPEELEGQARAGVVTVPIACQSEGALEVYVEPVLPSPHLVVIGRSPPWTRSRSSRPPSVGAPPWSTTTATPRRTTGWRAW